MPKPQKDAPQREYLSNALNLSSGVVTLVGAGGKTSLMFALARQLAAGSSPVLTTTTTKIQPPTGDQSPQLFEADDAEGLLHQLDRLEITPAHLTVLSPDRRIPEKRRGLLPEDIDALAASGRFGWILVEGDGAARKPLKAPADHEPVIPASSGHVIVVVGLEAIGQPLDEAQVHRAARFAELGEIALGAVVSAETLARVMVHPQGGLKNVPPGARVTVFLNKADAADWPAAGEAVLRALRNRPDPLPDLVVGSAQQGWGVLLC